MSDPRRTDDAAIAAGVDRLIARFAATRSLVDHLTIVDEPRTRQQFEWLRRHRPEVWRNQVYPAIRTSWDRNYATRPQGDQRHVSASATIAAAGTFKAAA